MLRKLGRIIRDQNVVTVRDAQALGTFGSGHDRRSQRHRFENLQPCTTASLEGHDSDETLCNDWADDGHITRKLTSGVDLQWRQINACVTPCNSQVHCRNLLAELRK